MNVINKRTILFYCDKYKAAETALLVWYSEFLGHEFQNFNELKAVYPNASIIANNRVVMNIKRNDYRLILSLNFKQSAVYIIWFGTHSEYDVIDVKKIEFDIRILNYNIN